MLPPPTWTTLAELDQGQIAQLYQYRDFQGFMLAFKAVTERLRQPEDYELITYELMRRLRAQIKDVRDRTKQSPAAAALEAFDQKLSALEGKTDSSFLPEDRGSLARVNSALNSLLGAVDSADSAPTAAAITNFADVQQWLKRALENWSAVKQRDLPQLNQTLQAAGAGTLAAPE